MPLLLLDSAIFADYAAAIRHAFSHADAITQAFILKTYDIHIIATLFLLLLPADYADVIMPPMLLPLSCRY